MPYLSALCNIYAEPWQIGIEELVYDFGNGNVNAPFISEIEVRVARKGEPVKGSCNGKSPVTNKDFGVRITEVYQSKVRVTPGQLLKPCYGFPVAVRLPGILPTYSIPYEDLDIPVKSLPQKRQKVVVHHFGTCPGGDDDYSLHGSLQSLLQVPGWAKQLRGSGFPQEVIRALDALTQRPGEDYGEYLVRVKANPLALRVKVADLRDNLDESRMPDPTEDDLRRWEKYRRALQELQC